MAIVAAKEKLDESKREVMYGSIFFSIRNWQKWTCSVRPSGLVLVLENEVPQ